MEAKEEERIWQGQVVNTPRRELEMTPPILVNARHITEYTNDDDGGRCDQSEIGIEVNIA